jgi:hypothetical protein
MHANVVNGDDVGVIEGGGGARFVLKAAQAVGIFRGRRTN